MHKLYKLAEGQNITIAPLYDYQDETAKLFWKTLGDIFSKLKSGELVLDPEGLILNSIITAPTAYGKCMHPDTHVLMADGCTKRIANIHKGDRVMGEYGPRNVVGTKKGRGFMYSVTPDGMEPFLVEENHVLSLKVNSLPSVISREFSWQGSRKREGDIIDITVNDYLSLKGWKKSCLRLYRLPIKHFECKKRRELSPYVDGYQFGSTGFKAATSQRYRRASYEDRLMFISGLLDSRGRTYDGGVELGIRDTVKCLDIKFIVESLGLFCHNPYDGLFRITGNLSILKCSELSLDEGGYEASKGIVNFTIEKHGVSDYRGICVDGNHRYILGNMLVTHNTRLSSRMMIDSMLLKDVSHTFVVPLDCLVSNTVKTLEDTFSYRPGVIKAGWEDYEDHSKLIQVASVQTLARRGIPDWLQERLVTCKDDNPYASSMIWIDEAHRAVANEYNCLFDSGLNAPIVGLTATPERTNKREGLTSRFTHLVNHPMANTASMMRIGDESRDENGSPTKGLARAIYYGFEQSDLPDYSDVRISKGDYKQSDLQRVCTTDNALRNMFREWKRLSFNDEQGRIRKSMVFCSTIEHSNIVANYFAKKGVAAASIDSSANQLQRRVTYARLRAGDRGHVEVEVVKEGKRKIAYIYVVDENGDRHFYDKYRVAKNTPVGSKKEGGVCLLSSVDMLSVGFDEPTVELIVFARKTKSPIIYVQQGGRGLRIAPWICKKDCVFLDFADIVSEFGFLEAYKPDHLDSPEEKEKGEQPMKVCPPKSGGCGAIVRASDRHCPNCGYEFPRKPVIEMMGRLKPLMDKDQRAMLAAYKRLAKKALTSMYQPNWTRKELASKVVEKNKKKGYDHWDINWCSFEWNLGLFMGGSEDYDARREFYDYLMKVSLRNGIPYNMNVVYDWVEKRFNMEFGTDSYSTSDVREVKGKITLAMTSLMKVMFFVNENFPPIGQEYDEKTVNVLKATTLYRSKEMIEDKRLMWVVSNMVNNMGMLARSNDHAWKQSMVKKLEPIHSEYETALSELAAIPFHVEKN